MSPLLGPDAEPHILAYGSVEISPFEGLESTQTTDLDLYEPRRERRQRQDL